MIASTVGVKIPTKIQSLELKITTKMQAWKTDTIY